MKKLYEDVDYNNLKFEYVGLTKDVRFYEYMDSRELFNSKEDNKINFNDVIKRQNEFLYKLSNIKIGKKKLLNKEKRCWYPWKIYLSREETINFFRDYGKMVLDAAYKSKQNETEGKGLKILTPKQMLQRLPIALAQVKGGNNSESLLNEIRQIVYSLYQS